MFAGRSFFFTVRGLSFPFNSRATRKKAKSGQAFLVFNIMYLLFAGWELITQSPQAGNTPPYLAGSWKFSQRHPGSREQLFFSQQEKKMEKCFQNRPRIMFLCSILNFANNCRWVPLALKRIITSKEFYAAVCEYKFSILLIILHSLLFLLFYILHISSNSL